VRAITDRSGTDAGGCETVGESASTAQRIADLIGAVETTPDFRGTLAHRETLEPQLGQFAEKLPDGFEMLRPLLDRSGIQQLYTHQARAIEHIEAGDNVVLATPTASGKTLVYNLPMLKRALVDSNRRALYVFPLKALEWDQRRRLEDDLHELGSLASEIRVEIYDGDTPQSRRRAIRDDPPQILITTPDMLHAGILPHHASWKKFFAGLTIVALDELHTYRGIFGSHVAQVLRRLERVTRFHGTAPQYVASSATVANPGELASALTGQPFRVVEDNGAPRQRRQVLMFRPSGSPYSLAAQLFRTSLRLGLRTIAFTKARVITELMHSWIVEAEPDLEARISSYRAGFLPEERRDIERRLFSGELLGVISTSALELGIDVGGLDVCLLVGYPGSQVATWQRGGRVGRSAEACIALIAQPDALDQYLVSHPQEFFDREFEHAVVDPFNFDIAAAHLPCAAAEVPIRATEDWVGPNETRELIEQLEADAVLLRSESGGEWFAARRRPHLEVRLRQIGSAYTIAIDGGQEDSPARVIGTIGASNVFSECHEGAIYLHRGRQYCVTELDRDELTVWVRAVNVPFYTRALSDKQTEILSRDRTRPAGNFCLVQGRVKVTTTVTGFERRRMRGQELLGTEPLELPPTSFETIGIWIEFPDEIPQALEDAGRHVMGGIHASEHAALSLFPLFALCDRHDVAGISYVRHPQTKRAAIFLYDRVSGGVGLAASLFDRIEVLLDATCELIADCPCEDGCPACCHSPRCSNGNRPIDKQAAVQALRLLLARDPLPALREKPVSVVEAAEPDAEETSDAPPEFRVVCFDLETQRSAQEVGGWHNAHLMRVALAVIHDSTTGRFQTFAENEVHALVETLHEADLVVGFNIAQFDYSVLRGYTDADLTALPTFDMLSAIHQRLGYRLPLGHIAEETLGVPKSGDGLQSLAWWKEGRVDEIERYCRQDVALLRDLLEHAQNHGYLCFRTKAGDRVRLPAPWKIPEIVERARARPVEATRRRPRAPRRPRSPSPRRNQTGQQPT
jgi:DEAD/DEAH box helicase domain-containing protein